MTISTRTVIKSYFETGDKPMQAQFSDFIDSTLFYEDTSDFGRALISASAAASARSLLGSGAVGDKLFIAITTASAQDQLGGGAVGKNIFVAITTASAQDQLGGGAVGINVFGAITTASAQNNLGGGAVGKNLFEVITTASAQEQIGLHEGLSIQVVHFQTGAFASGTTTIPLDDTEPQNTEGTEFMSASITPTNANNKLRIDVLYNGGNSNNQNGVTTALFQDSIASALCAASFTFFVGDVLQQNSLTYYMTAGTTSTITFKVRCGASGAGTTYFNGSGGARLFGGVLISSITITEIKA